MNDSEKIRRIRIKESIELQCQSSIEERTNRYLEIEHQGIIGGHHFAEASSECIYLYRDGYFIGAVMMSHAINEGIIKFIAKRNTIDRHEEKETSKELIELINELKKRNIISQDCADASTEIWKSFRADIHHMNPKVVRIPFQKIARQNLRYLSTIEREIFGYDTKNGILIPHKPKYWDIDAAGTTSAFLRLE